jgi:hypothetical protein
LYEAKSLLLVLLLGSLASMARPASPKMSILDYIKQTWRVLTRSHANLAGQTPFFTSLLDELSPGDRHAVPAPAADLVTFF